MRSEEELIEFLREKFPPGRALVGIGDDAAVFENLVFTTDMLVEGVHFLKDHPPFFLGRKAVNVNLSDLAAMGAEPLFILMSLAFPVEFTSAWMEEFSNGVSSACKEGECSLVGGDLSRADRIFISVTAVGRTDSPVLRGRAREGEGIYLVGDLGLARAGREALEKGIKGFTILEMAFWNPRPRLKEGLEAARLASSMIDVSDGFVLDLHRLLQGKGARLDQESLPIPFELKRFCRKMGVSPLDYVLYGGEDYALIYTSGSDHGPGRRVGEVTGDGRILLGEREVPVKGFSHFSGKPSQKF